MTFQLPPDYNFKASAHGQADNSSCSVTEEDDYGSSDAPPQENHEFIDEDVTNVVLSDHTRPRTKRPNVEKDADFEAFLAANSSCPPGGNLFLLADNLSESMPGRK